MRNFSEDSLKALENLFHNNDQKGLITRDNAQKFGELVFVEQICREAEPAPSHFVSLTEKGRKFCAEKFGSRQAEYKRNA